MHGATRSRPEYHGGVRSRTSSCLGGLDPNAASAPGGLPVTMHPSHHLLAPTPLSQTARVLQGLCPPHRLVTRCPAAGKSGVGRCCTQVSSRRCGPKGAFERPPAGHSWDFLQASSRNPAIPPLWQALRELSGASGLSFGQCDASYDCTIYL